MLSRSVTETQEGAKAPGIPGLRAEVVVIAGMSECAASRATLIMSRLTEYSVGLCGRSGEGGANPKHSAESSLSSKQR